MLSKIGYWGYYIISWFAWALPLRIAYFISDIFYIFIYKVGKYRIKVVRENLKNAFPEKAETERLAIERKFYHHFCDLFIESMQLMHMGEKEAKRRFSYTNVELFDSCYKNNKNMIAILGHHGNWETNITFPLWSSYKSLATYKPLNDPYFNAKMQKDRQRFGMEVVSMRNTIKRTLECVNSGSPTILALIADQAPMPNESDFWTIFLNQESAIFMGPEKVARKINATVIFIKMEKVKRGYYKVSPILICENAKETIPGEITQKHVAILEDIIHEKPEFWLWSHRRWKRKRPQNVNLQCSNE